MNGQIDTAPIRQFTRGCLGDGSGEFGFASLRATSSLFTRSIPSTGEPLPSVGLGTAEVFDVTDTATLQKASAVDGPVSVRCYGRAVVLSLRYCW
jgi:hypothetical protein